jgi:hypothetical protein
LDSKQFSSDDLIIRQAEPDDRSRIFAFLQEVWDGEDYLPSVWDDWVVDPAGQLVVAELDGEPIATARIVNLGHGEFWLEGLRVAKPYRMRGVAGQIKRYLLNYWEDHAGRSIGYLTHRDQLAVHKLAQAIGFSETFHVQMVRWDSAVGRHEFQPCEDLDWAAHKFTAWSQANGLEGRMELDWSYPKILVERIGKMGSVYAWRGDRAVVGLTRDVWNEQRVGVVACLCVELADCDEFFLDLARLCSMLELAGGRWFAPLKWLRLHDAANAGLQFVEDLEMVCYMKYR